MLYQQIKYILLNRYIQLAFLILILFLLVFIRIQYFNDYGDDFGTYSRAVEEFVDGTNPYEWTVYSYEEIENSSDHGYAYLPALLYVFTGIRLLSEIIPIDFHVAIKIPVLLADIGIVIFLFIRYAKKNFAFFLVSSILYAVHPHIYLGKGYNYADPITIFFTLLAFDSLGKKDFLSGIFFGLAVAFKTFPIIFLPIFLYNSKKLPKFLLGGFIVAFAISIPFMKTMFDFQTYINGALLVHSERYIQGRPILYYISYTHKLEFIRLIPFKFYSILATFSGWILITLYELFLKKKVQLSVFTQAIFPSFLFYIFTPVFNKTYPIWFMPIIFIGLYELFKDKRYYITHALMCAYWILYYWYIFQWGYGYHVCIDC